MAAVTIIKLTGENHRDIDAVATQIKTICDNGGISLRGLFHYQHDALWYQSAKLLMVKAVKHTITGKCAYTSAS